MARRNYSPTRLSLGITRARGVEYLEHRQLMSATPIETKGLTAFIADAWSSNNQRHVDIVRDASSDPIAVWSHFASPDDRNENGLSYGVYGRRFITNDAKAADASFHLINFDSNPENVKNNQRDPAVAVSQTGDAVVVWTSNQGNSGYDIYFQRFNAANNSMTREDGVTNKAVVTSPGNQSEPDVAMDSNGDFVVVWQSISDTTKGYDIYAQRYTATGTAIGSAIEVNSSKENHQLTPRVAMNALGDFAVTWRSDHSTNVDGSTNSDIYVRRFRADGTALGNEAQVNTSEVGNQQYPSIAMDLDGDFVIAWESTGHKQGSEWDVFARLFDKSGVSKVAPSLETFGSEAGDQRRPDVTMDATGDFGIVWHGAGKGSVDSDVFLALFEESGSRAAVDSTTANFRVSGNQLGKQTDPTISMNWAGDFSVAWEGLAPNTKTGRDVYTRGFTMDQTAPSPFIVTGVQAEGDLVDSTQQDIQRDEQKRGDVTELRLFLSGLERTGSSLPVTLLREGQAVPVISTTSTTRDNKRVISIKPSFNAILPAGRYEVRLSSTLTRQDGVALDGDYNGLPGGVFSLPFSIQTKSKIGDIIEVAPLATGEKGLPAISSGDNGSVVVWINTVASRSTVVGQRYSLNGDKVGNEFVVATQQGDLVMNRPHVAMNGLGSFVVVWDTDGTSDLYARRYNALGTPLGDVITVARSRLGQLAPTVAIHADGAFDVVWEERGANISEIFGQRFSQNGAPSGSLFKVGGDTRQVNQSPHIATHGAGDFIVTWRGFDATTSLDIYAQQYNSSGQTLGGELVINTVREGDQSQPWVSMSGAGNVAFVWNSNGRIVGRLFDKQANTFKGQEFPISSSTPAADSPHVDMNRSGEFVVAWRELSASIGDSYNVRAQRFDAAAQPQSVPLIVNAAPTPTTHPGGRAVNITSTGDFITTWYESGNVFFRRIGTSNASSQLEIFGPSMSVDESVAVGTPVMTLSSLDLGAGVPSLFTLVPGDGDANNEAFRIVGDQLISNDKFDFETSPTLTLRIRATTSAGLSYERALIIAVKDVIVAGDANGDDKVDLLDFALLRTNFGKSNTTRAMGDINEDGKVDLQDFAILRRIFGKGL